MAFHFVFIAASEAVEAIEAAHRRVRALNDGSSLPRANLWLEDFWSGHIVVTSFSTASKGLRGFRSVKGLNDSKFASVRQPGSDLQGFLKLARQVSETIGAEFLSMLANQLAAVLGAKCVYIGEFVQGEINRVQTLEAFAEGGRTEAFEFPLAGSPDAEVALGTPCIYPKGVREMFPGDALLQDLEAEAWVGVPLNNSDAMSFL